MLVKCHVSIPFLSWPHPKWQAWVHSIWEGHQRRPFSWVQPSPYLLETMALPHTPSQFNSLLPVLSCCGLPFIWSFWKGILQCKSKPSTIHFQSVVPPGLGKQKYLHVLCQMPCSLCSQDPRYQQSVTHCFTCFLSHLQECSFLNANNSLWFQNTVQPSTKKQDVLNIDKPSS